ncbi:hypothetical protein [Mangrovimonas sp. YM274]|uniref:hypothetical protein n=1 Tax=Mangrovimonas sp. YM274 TaxID=3070660 RepID=UPI0027DE5C53|nr:hypothetical protein [Mangrovimonas sp. YM274]WMI69307.1 hypothetical protein RBH95_02765 [Mangrovimonas sp. YM274]
MNTVKNILGCLAFLLLMGCTIESEFGLPNDENINPELIGEWGITNNDVEKITIQKTSDTTYKLAIKDGKEIEELQGYQKTIKGVSIMNVKTENRGKTIYTFYGFTVQDNTLTFSEVNDKLHKKEFTSESELISFFENNIEREDFFINQNQLKRI